MSDWYLEDRQRLERQPKRVIGEYVESKGILVPRRFAFTGTTSATIDIIARTEHPQDYDGASGLLDSKIFRSGEEIPDAETIIANQLNERKLPHIFSAITQQPEMIRQFSATFWECIPGYNRTVTADSAVSGRYHITTNSGHITTNSGDEEKNEEYAKCFNYTIIEKGKIIITGGMPLLPNLRERVGDLIEKYEQIRHLDHFDPRHCPLMEFQTTNEDDYFLQYLRTRNFEPATFTLNPKESTDHPVLFVRGATPPEGLEMDVTVLHAFAHSRKKRGQKVDEVPLPEIEEGAVDDHYHLAYAKAKVSKRKLQITYADDINWHFFKCAVKHEPREAMHHPQISLIINNKNIKEKIKMLRDRCNETGEDAKVRMHVISDGRNAVLRDVA